MAAVERIAAQIKRVKQLVPDATIFVVSDHGGNGGGHMQAYRDQHNEASDVDSAWHRDVPWMILNDPNPRCLCDIVRTDDTAGELVRHLGIPPSPTWRVHGVWLPVDYPCTPEQVSSRVNGSVRRAASISTAIFVAAALLVLS